MKAILVTLAALIGLAGSTCFAYYDVMDTGEIMPSGHYKLTGSGQLFTDAGGLDLSARFDSGLSDETGLRGVVGFGKTDYFLGGFFKWMPIPDIDQQPAIGLNVGALYGHDNSEGQLSLRAEPLVSKKFDTNGTVLTPYASLPIGLRMTNSNNHKDKNDVTWQLAVGTQMQFPRWKNLQFMAEVGIDIDNAPSYISGAAILYFDGENGIQIQ